MEHELLRARSNVQIATANLNRVTGLPISNATELSDEFSPVEFDLTEEQCLRAAMEYRPELGSLDRQRKAAAAALAGAKLMRLPTINFSGGWNWTSSKNIKNKDNWSLDLIGEWTLFGGMGITAGIRRARHAIEQLDEGLRQLIDGIALEVKTSYLNLVQSRKGIDVAKEAVKQAQENLRIFRERYAQGLVTSTDVLDAESQLARARADLASALYENNSALVSMESAMALPVEEVRRLHSEDRGEPAGEKEGESGQ
jgi:outer membrane protein